MGSDFWLVFQWWATLFLVGAAAWPLTKRLFHDWYDNGYLFSKAVGMAVVTWIVYVAGTLRLMPFSQAGIWMALIVVLGIGMMVNRGNKTHEPNKTDKTSWIGEIKNIFFGEVFFFAALFVWSWVKAHEPSIRGLEKFMDYGFMQSILNSRYFPPADMWYTPLPINYYYFGHLVTAVLTKLSGMDLAVTFNLMLATLFALCFTMSFSIGRQLLRIGLIRQIRLIGQIGGGLLTAFLVTLAGNMQTIYAFTRGYDGENVKPFWGLAWKISEIGGVDEIWGKIAEGMQRYWYANATRFIPFTIHEFPGYSFVVSDVHGHVLSIPFVLMAIALLMQIFCQSPEESHQSSAVSRQTREENLKSESGRLKAVFYGFLCGVLLMTNATDGVIYFGLLLAVLSMANWSHWTDWPNWKEIGGKAGLAGAVAVITSLPFLSHFKSFVNGVAVNCPPSFLANTKIGPIIFEGAEKCQKSPLWMLWLLWGFFVFCGGWWLINKISPIRQIGQIRLIWNNNFTQIERLLMIFFFFSLALVVFPEFFYFKDIYPAHFRSNTMFKLGYQAFIMFSIVAGYTIVKLLSGKSHALFPKSEIRNPKFETNLKSKYQFFNKIFTGLTHHSRNQSCSDSGNEKLVKQACVSPVFNKIFIALLIPQLFLVSIFPVFSVRSYFNGLKNYEGIDGLGWLRREYPGDYLAIQWLNNQIRNPKSEIRNNKHFTLVEADGDSYTDYSRVSAFTGIPTIIGWPVHEWLWRGSYDAVSPRREEVRAIYEPSSMEEAKGILDKYKVRYIVVGALEREKFKVIDEVKLQELGREVFRHMETVIYEVPL